MTLLYYDPIFLQHLTGSHPENAGRLQAVHQRLQRGDLLPRCQTPTWQPADLAQVQRVHDPAMFASIESFAAQGGGRIEVDTVVSPHSLQAACMAAGAACDAVRRVVGDDGPGNAFCLVRPPGHHATADQPMGFCLLNHVAIAARHAIDQLGLDRVLIVDWDVHHGNGTQDIFWEDPQVGFLSMHRYPFYPGSGAAGETGSGAGLGTTVNVPIEYGTAPATQLQRFATKLESLADKMRPQLVLISAGFDSHRRDPIGSLDLESEDFTTLTSIVLQVAQTHAGGRVVSLLEGGYDPTALAESVECHLRTLCDAP